MEDYFPLYFNKSKKEISRGLSCNQSDKIKYKPYVYLNPRKLPERSPKYKLTLVWDLDQTLVAAEGVKGEDELDLDTQIVIRPHAREILNILKRNHNVEFIVWTAGTKSHAERVVGSFPNIVFDHIIARNSSWYSDKNPIKNLNLIVNESRPLSTMVLMDDRMDIGTEHPENLLVVPPYYPKKYNACDDSTMLYLVNILQRAIDLYDSKNSFATYIFSPLTEKCSYEGHTYYGVKCFESKEDLQERIKSFEMIVPSLKDSESDLP